jgi:repressor LexA
MRSLTRRQKQVLDYLREYIGTTGYPPTLREIADRFSFSGPRAAAKHLESLQRKGHIIRIPGISRGLEIIGQRSPDQIRRVPVLGSVPAGPLDLAFEDADSTFLLDPNLAGEGTFLLRVRGDSMSGDHILPGDLVLVKAQDTAEDGDLAVVLVGEEATLKRFFRSGDAVKLMSSNPKYRPIILTDSDDGTRILGKVRAVIRITDGGRL